jgi:hypothetical protein
VYWYLAKAKNVTEIAILPCIVLLPATTNWFLSQYLYRRKNIIEKYLSTQLGLPAVVGLRTEDPELERLNLEVAQGRQHQQGHKSRFLWKIKFLFSILRSSDTNIMFLKILQLYKLIQVKKLSFFVTTLNITKHKTLCITLLRIMDYTVILSISISQHNENPLVNMAKRLSKYVCVCTLRQCNSLLLARFVVKTLGKTAKWEIR